MKQALQGSSRPVWHLQKDAISSCSAAFKIYLHHAEHSGFRVCSGATLKTTFGPLLLSRPRLIYAHDLSFSTHCAGFDRAIDSQRMLRTRARSLGHTDSCLLSSSCVWRIGSKPIQTGWVLLRRKIVGSVERNSSRAVPCALFGCITASEEFLHPRSRGQNLDWECGSCNAKIIAPLLVGVEPFPLVPCRTVLRHHKHAPPHQKPESLPT